MLKPTIQQEADRSEVYAMVSFGHKESREDKNSSFFFSVYVGMVDAALMIDPGIVVEWHGPIAWDPVPEIAAIRTLTERAVDGITVTAADSEALNPAIDDAIGRGIPVMNFDADSPESRRLTFVGTNNFKAGYLAGQKMAEWIAGEGDVMVASIPHAAHLDARLQGFKTALEEFAPHAELHITYDFASTGLDETGEEMEQKYRRVTARMLKEHPSIRGTFVTFAGVCVAVAEVVERFNLQDIIQGMAFDVDGFSTELVASDRIRGVVGQDTYLMGYVSMILLHAARHAPVLPIKEDGRWRISALRDFLEAHSHIPIDTERKIRRIISELEQHVQDNPAYMIDTSVKILEKDTILKELSAEFEDMRESLAAKINVLGDEIAIRKHAEHDLRLLNEELEQRVEARTAEVVRQKYILDSFMANVPDSIYFKDRDNRFMQVNNSLAALFDIDDPAEVVGKTDFDFFPEAEARAKYDREQEIVRTGQALLNVEEPHAGGRWALTSKMPLRDEHGEIIGTFGISRDITPLKQAQQAVEHAYSEISALNAKLQEENLRMSAELDIARRLQAMVLPHPAELESIEGLDIVGYMKPADEVGGDYYDVVSRNGTLHIGIGDVTGHGLESGVLMLMAQTAVRTLIDRGDSDPATFLNTLNRVLYQNIQRMNVDKSLTLAFVHYGDNRLKLIGQHEEMLVVRRDGHVERLDTVDLGFPIGLQEDISSWVDEATVKLEAGDGVVLYTDGITEAENDRGELYGIERLCETISRNWTKSAEGIKQAVIDDVFRHIGQQKVYDDVTLVVLKQQ